MKTRLIGCLCMVLACLTAGAVPALRTPVTVMQPDGRPITVVLTGDEWCHYYTTTDGKPVYQTEQGYFVPYTPFQLAMLHERSLVRRQVRNQELRKSGTPSKLCPPLRQQARRGPTGTQRVLVILAQFTDKKFAAKDPNAAFMQHLNGENYKGSGYGSARDYFVAQSGGKFTPQFDVYGPYTASKEMKYYGGNDSEGYDEHAGDLIAEVLKQGNKDIDFKDYDTDGDGVIDFCYVIYAGYGEAQSGGVNTIWPHQWTLADATGSALKLDGVQVNAYACSNELHGNSGTTLDGIGTICHEFGHCLGLPDFYDTSDDAKNFGMSVWSIMDYGCYNENGNTPAGYTAYEKEFLDWMDIETIDAEQQLTLLPTADGGKAYRIVTAENTDEYFVIENIQKKGWNRGAYGHGLLITHVDYKASAWKENTVNNGDIQRMTIVPADGSRTKSTRSWAGDLYPGSTGNTEFSDYSTPASLTNQNLPLSKPITDIKEENGVVTCNFMKGRGETTTALAAAAVTPYSFTARWNARYGTEEYVAEIYRILGTYPDDPSEWTTALFTEQGELIHTIHTPILQMPVDNLEASQLYCYRVRCRTNGVLSAYSNLVYVKTPADSGELPAPELLNPIMQGDSTFTLAWHPVEGAQYIVEYAQLASAPPVETQADGQLLLTEHFDRVTTSNGDISRVLDLYTDTTDWRGSEVHALESCVLLGSEKRGGYLLTPILPCTEGMVTVEFSVRRFSTDDKQPILHVCLATDADSKAYVAQIGSYVTDDDYKNYYCVLGPLDTGSYIAFISNSEQGSSPRVRIDNLSVYLGDRREEEEDDRSSGVQIRLPDYQTNRLTDKSRLSDYQTNRLADNSPSTEPLTEHSSDSLKVYKSDSLKSDSLKVCQSDSLISIFNLQSLVSKSITTSACRYVETADTFFTFTGMESGNYVCRVRAIKSGVFSPYSDAHTAIVGATVFEAGGMNYEIISLDHHTVQLLPPAKGHYEGDIVVPETLDFEGITYTVTALADSAFRGCTQLTSVTVPPTVAFAGSKLFKGCISLGWVDWQCEAAIDSTAFIGSAANTLLYVPAATEVSSGDVIVVRDGQADSVTLNINSPFLAPRPFTARHVRYQKDFSQKNRVGRTSGWETIVLPFDVQRVEHESRGILTPFGTSGSDHHFWLGRYGEWEFKYAQDIKANVPYVIALPNSDDYAPADCLNGVITFSASDATVHATLDVPPVEGTNFAFVPVYKKVYRQAGRYMLNTYDESHAHIPPGSEFQSNTQSVRTFGAYMQANGRTAAPERLPIQFSEPDIPHSSFLIPNFPYKGEAYTPDGRLVSPPDGPAPAGSFPHTGIYITHGKKYLIR
ncbi:MAG: M6 family metalloprotease domain-containing protein [Bacteroidaceae bacterium]|nr:M6 family metalloprotease domain-containing protein [Bacteroidaceae bacterium]